MKLYHIERVEEEFKRIILDNMIKYYLIELKNFDIKTYIHTLNVCFLSLDIGVERNFSQKELENLAYASIFHEIGKLNLSLIEIREKNGENVLTRTISPLRECPRRAYMSLNFLNMNFIGKIITTQYQYQKSNVYSRRDDRRRTIRGDCFERRTIDEEIVEYAQILTISDMVEKISRRNTNYTPQKIYDYLSTEFLGNVNYVESVMLRLNC